MLLFMHQPVRAQNDLGSEDALRREAQKMFEEEDYDSALKFYLRLLSANLKDPLYNYRYGVCLLQASADKEEAVKYLDKASKDPATDKEVYYFLGRALQLNYRFNDAINAYTKYKSLVPESKAKKLQIDHQIETCKNGKSLLRKISDIQVIDKKNLDEKDFFRSYDLSDIGGRLLVKPDDFRTPLDKKKKENSIIFLSPDKNEIYFSSYGSSDENGKDIYVIKRLPNGEYGKPVSLGYPINTEYDEDYPFLHPNGKVLYFASKGHNSMGGYDLFKSERNEETGVWGKPVNLDFPICTPDDDILFVTDKDEKTAYFASRRISEKGRIDVYHIALQRKPVDLCVFQGKFTPMSDGQGKAAKITVKNIEINEVEGMVKANESEGEYTLNLPNGGKFLITVESPEGDIQSDMLIIPQQFETVPIRQEITYANSKLHINTFFGQSNADDDRLGLAIDLIRDKAKMDVNTSRTSEPALVAEKTDSVKPADTTTVAIQPKKNLTNEDLVQIADKDASDLEKEAKDLREAADKALLIVNEKNTKVQELNKNIAETRASAEETTDPSDKQLKNSRADALQIQENTAETEVVAANNFANSLDQDAVKKQKEASLTRQYATDLAEAIKSKSKDAMSRLDAQKEALEKLNEDKSNSDDAVSAIRKEADNKQKEVNKVRDESARMRNDITGMEAEVVNLSHEEGETKNEQLKDGLKGQITGLKEDIRKKEEDLASNDLKLSKLQRQAENLNNQAYLVRQMDEQIKSGQLPVSTESIDKNKLNEQISAYHPKSDEISEGTTSASHDTSHTITEVKSDILIHSDGSKDVIPEKNQEEIKQMDSRYAGVVSSANSRPGELEKEQGKADAYKQWADALNSRVEEKTAELKNTEDKEKKDQLTEEIAFLTKNQQEKQRLANESTGKAEKLKQTNSGSEQTRLTQPSYTSEYKKKADESDTISVPRKKEEAKSLVYTEWAAAIRKDAVEKKKQLNETPDPVQKEKLQEQINLLEKEADTKESTAKELSVAATTRKTEPNRSLTPHPDYENSFSSQMGATEAFTGTESKDSVRAVIYEQWIGSISKDIEERKSNLASIKDTSQKRQAEQAIADKETELAGKKAAAARLASKIEKKNALVKATPTSDTTTARTEIKKADETTSGMNTVVNGDAPNTLIKSPAALASEEKRNKLNREASILIAQSDSLKRTAVSLVGTEKETKLKQAESIAKAAEEKKDEAATAEATANHTEFEANERKLVQYDAQPGAITNPDLGPAGAMTEVSRNYFEKAKKQRDEASHSRTLAEKKENLKQAEENENLALENQGKAVKLYAAAYPNLKLKDTIDTPHSHVVSSTEEHTPVEGIHTGGNPTDTVKTEHAAIISHTEDTPGKREPVKDTVRTEHAAIVSHTTDTPAKHEPVKDTVRTEHALVLSHTEMNTSDTSGRVKPAAAGAGLSNEDIDVKNSPEYKQIVTLKAQEDVFEEAVRANNHQADEYQLAGQNYTREMDKMLVDSAKITDPTEKASKISKSKEYEILANQQFAKTDSFRAISKQLNKKILELRTQSTDILSSLSPTRKEKIIAMTENKEGTNRESVPVAIVAPVKQENKDASTPPAETVKASVSSEKTPVVSAEKKGTPPVRTEEKKDNSTGIKKENAVLVKKDNSTGGKKENALVEKKENTVKTNPVISSVRENFSISSKETSSKKIEMDPKLPEGLLFKVQIGAFRHTISGDPFRGVNPLTGETTDKGFIRYTAGLFTKFESADKAKNDIRALGFRDAFVVAFLNGKRIPMSDALEMLGKGGNVIITGGNRAGNRASVSEGKAKDNTDGTLSSAVHNPDAGAATTPNDLPHPVRSNASDLAKSTPIEDVKGMFYTVQVGVYSKPVTNELLHGIQPLNTEKMENGNLRYTSGQYTDPLRAEEARRKIVELGVKDAFVVAYKDGKRLSSIDTRKTNGLPVPSVNIPPVKENKGTTIHETIAPQSENKVPDAIAVKSDETHDFSRFDSKTIPMVKGDTGVVFKVQIGAFKEQVPIEIANKFLLLSKRGVKNFKDENGLTVFTIGCVRNYDDAQFLKEEAAAKGIPDAFILAYKNGLKISVAEAKGDK